MTSRRGFLKACAAVVAGAILIPEFRLIEPDQPLFDGESLVAEVRELVQYSLHYQALMFRYDILGPANQQFYVDAMIGDEGLTAFELEKVRETCAAELQRGMRERGWKLTDLKPWPKVSFREAALQTVKIMAQRNNGEIFLFGQSNTELWT